MTPSNDNTPTQAWIDLISDVELFNELTTEFPEMIWHIKAGGGLNRERSAANFIWFMRFELSFRKCEIDTRRKEMKVIK